LNKKAQEEADSEIAKRLQEEFDKQQRQSQSQPQSQLPTNSQLPFSPVSIPVPVLSQTAVPISQEAKEDCPVCGLSFPVKSLPAHVETHFSANSSATPANNPSSPTNQPGFFAKFFGQKKKDETPQPSAPQQIQQQQQPQPQLYQPIVSPSGDPYRPAFYPVRLAPGQIPPQGSMVYRVPQPNGYPQVMAPPPGSVYVGAPKQQ